MTGYALVPTVTNGDLIQVVYMVPVMTIPVNSSGIFFFFYK